MTTKTLDKFGIHLMDGEQLLFEAGPNDGFERFFTVSSCLTIVGILVAPIVYVAALISRSRYRYWLTNRRVILSSGFIGYRVRSVPLERVSDVVLSNTLPEMLAGIRSVIVRDMTGEVDSGKTLLAVDQAGEVQRKILDEVQRVNSARSNV